MRPDPGTHPPGAMIRWIRLLTPYVPPPAPPGANDRAEIVPGSGALRLPAGRRGDAAVVIRTPDQRLRVFVSSTLGELAAERRAVSRAISAQRLTPVMFELGARPHPPRDLYGAYLAQSDIFIGLYWQHYGQVGPGMLVSGLEEEFELSRALPHCWRPWPYSSTAGPSKRRPRWQTWTRTGRSM
jgi:hypothetical protein